MYPMQTVSLIVAMGAKTRAIGRNNELIWHIPGDLPRFKTLTLGHPIIMGYNTYLSIGKPLPGRTNIVLTHDLTWSAEGVLTCHSLKEALETACTYDDTEVFVIGGGMVYKEALPFAQRLYLTLVDDDTTGDVFFPDYASYNFKEISRENHTEQVPHFAWVTLERI
jgi:dihydrofolate reductase